MPDLLSEATRGRIRNVFDRLEETFGTPCHILVRHSVLQNRHNEDENEYRRYSISAILDDKGRGAIIPERIGKVEESEVEFFILDKEMKRVGLLNEDATFALNFDWTSAYLEHRGLYYSILRWEDNASFGVTKIGYTLFCRVTPSPIPQEDIIDVPSA